MSGSEEQAGARGYVPPGQRDYRHRFRLAYAALAVVFWAAVAGVALSVTGGIGGGDGPPWSAWRPQEKGLDAAREIAAHVGSRYHLAGGRQLVAVRAHTPDVLGGVPLVAVTVRGGSSGDVVELSEGKSIVYELCGQGTKCAIDVGKPTKERARLVRREALELALYTFKYVRGVDSVITFLPPPPTKKPKLSTVFFRQSELEQELDRPLRDTLPDPVPPTPAALSPSESDTIERLTAPRWFNGQFEQLQNGAAILVLDPLTASG